MKAAISLLNPYTLSTIYSNTSKNLVARGEHRPGQPGSDNQPGSSGFEGNQNVLGNPLDPSVEGSSDFNAYSVAHQPEGY